MDEIGTLLKQLIPKLVNKEEAEIFIVVRLVQLLKLIEPILVTVLGIVMLVKLVQPLNEEDPILVTVSGIVTLVKLVQL